jgi:hypothetical protein
MRRICTSHRVAALFGLAVLTGTATTSAQAGPSIRVNPAAGTQTDTFTITGQGFLPGTVFDERYVSPAGDVVAYMQDGEPAVINAEDGSFVVTVLPQADFVGHDAGTWVIYFCVRDDPEAPASDPDKCFAGSIDIGL